ncbi:hypothetical protein E2C01_038047 [Portunus trituberculatus]|uniref:Uncharacterized protein n=1 Tax=Portunus trituberculatus TaxID=210409 RepID=A0A5B7FGY2_PORTR|nr:hypothetical protein [Portunus trituberculatus]
MMWNLKQVMQQREGKEHNSIQDSYRYVHNAGPKDAAFHAPAAQFLDDAPPASAPLLHGPFSELQSPGALFLKAKQGSLQCSSIPPSSKPPHSSCGCRLQTTPGQNWAGCQDAPSVPPQQSWTALTPPSLAAAETWSTK